MTLQTEIEAEERAHRVGYYVVFDGIATRLATHDPDDGETYITGMEMPRADGQTLDRRQGVVRPGGFSVSIPETAGDELAALFARRGNTEVPLGAGLDDTSTTIVIERDFANRFASGATVYVGQETITLGTYTASPSPRFTGCTRGAEGSIATEHQIGVAVSNKPTHWLGRRGVLYEVNLETNTAAAIRAGILEESPSCSQRKWTLALLDVTTVLNRPICTGFEEVDALRMSFSAFAITVDVDDATQFVVSDFGRVRVLVDGVAYFHKVESVDTGSTPNTVTLLAGLGPAEHELQRDQRNSSATLRQVAFVTMDPAQMALHVMRAKYGAGGGYDSLPGVAPDDGEGTRPARRMGAAIPEAWVDVDAFEALIGETAGVSVFVLDEQQHLLDFLRDEVLWRLGAFLYVTPAGKLSVKRYTPGLVDSSLPVYTETDLAAADIAFVDDEAEALSAAVVECNYDYNDRTFRHRTAVTFSETQELYGTERDTLTIKSKSTRMGVPSGEPTASQPTSEVDLQAAFLRMYARTRLGLRRLRFALSWRYHLRFFCGYRAKVTLPRVPNGEGGYGITAAIFEVVHVDPMTDNGKCVVEVDIVPTGKAIGPRLEVSSISGTTIGLLNDTDLFPNDPQPIFPPGCQVVFYDASASPPFSASETQTVSSESTFGTVVVDAAPSSFALAVGDHAQLVWGSGNTGTPNDYGADVDDYATLNDSNGEVDGEFENDHKWS